MFIVTTTVAKAPRASNVSGQGGNAGAQVSVQPYAIKLSVNRNLVDLFDPDA
jgi:hypothetical protein